MCVVVFIRLLPCEVCIVEGGLVQPCVVHAFHIVGEVMLENFVALEEVPNDWYFCFYYVVESFWSLLEEFNSGVFC